MLNAAEQALLFELAGHHGPHSSPAPSDALPVELLTLPAQITVLTYTLDHT